MSPPLTTQHFIVATAGHVDHGKSALVKALTGTDPDRLPEEKARGITIDLGFARLQLSTFVPTPATLDLGIVDVPGHEDFVKNMVAGVGSIDLALFVVAADDGWMPQTEEHLQILSYLGVTRAVVALTKIDLNEPSEATITARLREQLRDTPFAEAPIVATSVVTGRGLDELKTALTRVLADTPQPRDLGKPRLPVDRVFTLRGVGTVVTGTLRGGTLRRGQAVMIQPSGLATRIRSLQNHNCNVESAGPGTRTALNLPDVTVGSVPGSDVQRGEVVTLAELGAPTDTTDVLLEKSARLTPSQSPAARPLKDGALVRVHLGSGNVPARVLLLTGPALLPGQRELAQLRFESPVMLFDSDRFIIRDWPEQNTLAGGIVLESAASRKLFRDDRQRKFLEARAAALRDAQAWAASQLTRDRAVQRAGWLRQTHFSAVEISEAVSSLVALSRAVLAGDWVADAVWWHALLGQAAEAIRSAHRAHPEQAGLPLTELRPVLERQLPAGELFEWLLVALCQNEFVRTGAALRQVSHRPALPPHLQAAGSRLRVELAARPFEPPARKELASDLLAQKALRFLLETGVAIELNEETVMSAEGYARATELIAKFLRDHGPATASQLRQTLGTNRRIIIPLLEKLDRDGVTLRQGDTRVLRNR